MVTRPAFAPSSLLPDPGFEDLAQADAWAHARGVGHLLGLATSALERATKLPAPPQLGMWRLPLSALLLRKNVESVGEALRAQVRAIVQDVVETELRQVAIAEQEERAPRAPAHAAAQPLWDRLCELRASLRAHAAPRPAEHRRRHPARFSERTGELQWTEPLRWAGRGYGFFPEACLRSERGVLQCTCTCSPGAGCAHRLTLVDCALDALADGASPLGEALLRELGRPPWQCALDALGPTAPPSTTLDVPKRGPPKELWWRVERVLGRWTLAPEVRRGARGGRVEPSTLLRKYGEVLDERDRHIAELLARDSEADQLSGAAFLAAVGHPRITCDEFGDDPVPLLRAALGLRVTPIGRELLVEPALEGEACDARLFGALLGTHPPGTPFLAPDLRGGRLVLVDASRHVRHVLAVLDRHGATFPEEAQAALLERLAELRAEVPVTLAASVLGHAVAARPTLVLRLRLPPDGALEAELRLRPGPGAPHYAPGEGPRDVILPRGGERGYVRRALQDEAAWAKAALAELPAALARADEGPPWVFTVSSNDDALALVAELAAPREGLEVEWLGERPKLARRITAKELRVAVHGDADWFSIEGSAALEEGRLELATLLDAARRQRRFVQVGPGRFAELADELRAQLANLAARTFRQSKGVGLSTSAVPALAELAELGASVEEAPAWAALRERIAAAGELSFAVPERLEAELRPYQRDGYHYLARLAAWGAGGCLADDMGLGKTVQAIALLLARAPRGPQLVLAPTSVCWSWAAELSRFAPSLGVVALGELPAGAARDEALGAAGPGDVVIASYGVLLRELSALRRRRFATIVFDEAQALKNPETLRTKAACALAGEARFALTGTPLQNHLGELWSLYSVVLPGLLGSWSQFRDTFAGPIERMADQATRSALAQVLRPFLLRRTKAEVAADLPPKVELDVRVELSTEETALYEDARLAAVAELTGRGAAQLSAGDRFAVLAALTRLRLLACHPRLYDPTSRAPSSKLARAVELLDELRAEGHRALVFSQFTSHLALVREALAERGFHTLYLDGETPPPARERLVRAFQDGDGEVFLISLGAGGTGLTLTGADYVLHLDPWWNPAVEDQATDRAHRIGQARPVTVVRLIARGTIEEKIVALHAKKRALVADVLEGKGGAAALSAQELAELLAAGELARSDGD